MIIAVSIIVFLSLSIATLFIFFGIANEKDMAATNKQLTAIKLSKGTEHLELDDPEVRKILDQKPRFIEEYLSYAGILILMYFIALVVFLGRVNKNAKNIQKP